MTIRGPHVDELISAGLHGDLTDAERAQLDGHLATCPACRATSEAFAAQRRLVSGLRPVAPPADLWPRVSSAASRGAAPWHRRPRAALGLLASLATVAAVLLAAVLIARPTHGPLVAASSSPSASTPATSSSAATGSAIGSPTPSATGSAAPAPGDPRPVGYFVAAGGRLQFIDPRTNRAVATITSPDAQVPAFGPVIGAALSPDGGWVAFRTRRGLSGQEGVWATRLSDARTFALGSGMETGSPFIGQLAWSADSSMLAFTLASTSTPGAPTDAWLFSVASTSVQRLTNTGRVVVGSFDPANGGLWVSTAGADGQPNSYRLPLAGGTSAAPRDPAQPGASDRTLVSTFLPILAPDGKHAIYWRGMIGRDASGWQFTRGGMPYLGTVTGGDFTVGQQQLFPTLTIPQGGEAFSHASIVWGADSDSFAAWNAAWTGTQQPTGFPDAARIYFGHVSGTRLLVAESRLDPGDTGGDGQVIGVAVAADGVHLAIAVQRPIPGDLATPRADLYLVKRNLGSVPDEVQPIAAGSNWNGVAVYQPAH